MSHSYSSDISREQFAWIFPCLESARRRTKPRTVDLYDVFCGVLYWTLRILSGISEGICNTMVQSGGDSVGIGVGGR